MGEFCRLPLEALQYPQAFDKNPKLKRTYHVRRDRNRIRDKSNPEVCRSASTEFCTRVSVGGHNKSLSVGGHNKSLSLTGQSRSFCFDNSPQNSGHLAYPDIKLDSQSQLPNQSDKMQLDHRQLPANHASASQLPANHTTATNMQTPEIAASQIKANHTTASQLQANHTTASQLQANHTTASQLRPNHAAIHITKSHGKPVTKMSIKGRSRSIDNFDSTEDPDTKENTTIPSTTTVIIKDKDPPPIQIEQIPTINCTKKIPQPIVRLEWWQDFDLLLQHPIGLRLFTEFLTKEFSEENIVFWKACQEYRKISDGATRATRAEEIFNLYLAGDAPEPVNVDSGARQTAKDAVSSAVSSRNGSADIFLASQKQIYNLMKMDSFQRFLQSNLFKEFIEKNKDSSDGDGKQGKNKGEGKKWSMTGLSAISNIIARAKSKERETETEGPTRTFSSPDIAILSQTCPDVQFTRIVLPDKSTAILTPRPDETIGQMVQTLLRRRGEDKAFAAQTDKGDHLDILQRCSSIGERTVVLKWV